MPTPFDTISVSDAKKLLASAVAPVDTLIATIGGATENDARQTSDRAAPNVNLLYYKGDHWQNGCEWAGPQPSGAGSDVSATIAEIRKAFVSKNVVRECCDRHTRAVIGGEPQWSFTTARPLGDGTPTPEEQARIDETDALIEWWDGGESKRGALQALQDTVVTLLCTGKASLRLWIPKRYLQDGTVSASSLKDALTRIYLQAPVYGQAGVATDEDSQEQIGVYQAKDAIEVCYLDGNMTVLGQSNTQGELVRYDPMDLGGRLLIFQLECSPLITEQVRAQQRLLNMALTMLSRNVILAGFLERIFLNAQMPGHFEGEGDERHFVYDPLDVGAGAVTALKGIKVKDEDGNERYADPSVVFRDPVPVTTFTDTRDVAYRGMLEETQQLYSLTSGQYAISADSRREARYDFITSLRDTITQIEAAGRWLLETTLALAAEISGQPGRYNDLRAVFECRVDTGPIDATERDAILKEVEAGVESKEGAMVRLGRTDPDATLQQIASEQAASAKAQADATRTIPRRQPITDSVVSQAQQFLSDAQKQTQEVK